MADPFAPQPELQQQALQIFQQTLDPIKAETNRYIDGLLDLARGDLDYASKIIEENFQTALGTDDTARKEFFKEVANELENRVGRIVYDYQTGRNRLEQDIASETERTTQARDLALSRLAEDEQLNRQGLLREAIQARREQGTRLNARGILAGPRGEAVGLAGQEVQDLEGEINRRFEALGRLSGRGQEDITTQSSQQLSDITRSGQRGLEDLTTSARRAGLDQQTETQRQQEAAKRDFEAEQRRLEADRFNQLRRAEQLARESAQRQFV